MKPACGVAISNRMGTAPGLFCEKSGKIVVALPGPPREFNPMAKTVVQEYLARHTGGAIIHSKVVRVCGLGESRVEELIRDLIENEDPTVAPYAKTGEVHLRVTARGQGLEEASSKIEPMVAEIRRRLSWHVYGFDDQSLEDVVIAGCKAHGYTIAVAESCTAGNLGGRTLATGAPRPAGPVRSQRRSRAWGEGKRGSVRQEFADRTGGGPGWAGVDRSG